MPVTAALRTFGSSGPADRHSVHDRRRHPRRCTARTGHRAPQRRRIHDLRLHRRLRPAPDRGMSATPAIGFPGLDLPGGAAVLSRVGVPVTFELASWAAWRPRPTEKVTARIVEAGLAELLSTPFLASGVSRGDLVSVTAGPRRVDGERYRSPHRRDRAARRRRLPRGTRARWYRSSPAPASSRSGTATCPSSSSNCPRAGMWPARSTPSSGSSAARWASRSAATAADRAVTRSLIGSLRPPGRRTRGAWGSRP